MLLIRMLVVARNRSRSCEKLLRPLYFRYASFLPLSDIFICMYENSPNALSTLALTHPREFFCLVPLEQGKLCVHAPWQIGRTQLSFVLLVQSSYSNTLVKVLVWFASYLRWQGARKHALFSSTK